MSKPLARTWTVYVLHSKRAARTYVGVTNDVPRRLLQHNGRAPGGARATRPGRPWKVRVIYGPFATRGEAQQVEHQVKQRRGSERLRWEPAGPDRPARARALREAE